MSKIVSAQLHHSDRALDSFSYCAISLVRTVRAYQDALESSRTSDIGFPGALHALAKVCAQEKNLVGVIKQEVELWQTQFFKWFKRVEKRVDPDVAVAYLKNAENDFALILAASTGTLGWEKKSREREFSITFPDEESLQKAHEAAKAKYPVQLGIALREFLQKTVHSLVDDSPMPEAHPVTTTDTSPKDLALKLMFSDDGSVLLAVTSFKQFAALKDLEEDIIPTAYDLESAVRAKLTSKTIALLNFDSESSLFSVSSSSQEALGEVSSVLIQLAQEKLHCRV